MKETFLKYEHIFKCTFSRGKAGPLPGVVHVKIQMGMARPIFFGFEIWADPIYFWGCRKLALFYLGYIKATATVALFHPRLQCNFQKLLRCHRE